MARTIINLPLRNSVDESYNTAVNILQANGFKEVSYNGETVWKKGTGLLTAIVCNLHKNCVLLLSCILYYAML